MQNSYYNQLPDDIRGLVTLIEDRAELQIQVEVDNQRSVMACEADESRACLLIPSSDYFPDGSVLHELLHLRRFLVEKVPQIVVCDNHCHPELDRKFTLLDNNLEHLIIVPEEICIRPKRREYWVSVTEGKLVEHRSAGSNANIQEDAIYLHIFVQHVLKHEQLMEQCQAFLESVELLDRANCIYGDVLLALNESKEVLVRSYISHFDVPKDMVCLDYLDSTESKRRHIKLY